MITTLLLLCLILFILALPYIKSNLADISSVALEHQSSVGPTRETGESAIYRSVDVPNGVPLTGGLGIRIGYQLRDGNLKDIWSIALTGGAKTKLFIQDKWYSIPWINGAMVEIARNLPASATKVAIFSDMDSIESILFLLTSLFVTEKTIINLNSLPADKIDVDLLLVDAKHYGKVSGLFKKILVIGDSPDESIGTFDTLVKLDSVKESTDFRYTANEDYTKFNNQPYSEVNDRQEVKFYQRSFVASIAAHLRSLPTAFLWSSSDSVLISVQPFDSSSKNSLLLNLLSSLMEKVDQIGIIPESKLNSDEDIFLYQPSILVARDTALFALVQEGLKRTSPLKKFLISRAEHFNSEGIFSNIGKLSATKLRLIYSQQSDSPLTSLQYNTIRSTLGSRIIREKYNRLSMGPILKTNLYDYRVLSGGLTELGVASNSLELKIVKKHDDDKYGALLARGYSLGKDDTVKIDDTMWIPMHLSGMFARDGCFYVQR